MTFLKLLLGGLVTTAAYGGVRYWLTRGRSKHPASSGTDVVKVLKAKAKEP